VVPFPPSPLDAVEIKADDRKGEDVQPDMEHMPESIKPSHDQPDGVLHVFCGHRFVGDEEEPTCQVIHEDRDELLLRYLDEGLHGLHPLRLEDFRLKESIITPVPYGVKPAGALATASLLDVYVILFPPLFVFFQRPHPSHIQ
jgi:hypothetical protein